MSNVVTAADHFCGGGGMSAGLSQACADLGLNLKLIAINHWPVAITTHRANHPKATHLCTSLDAVDPRKAVPGGKLRLLVASPECTHHSIARAGKPMNDQSRASAFLTLRWLDALLVDSLLVENVPEFLSWGALGTNGRPLVRRKGELFRHFIGMIEALGYKVEWKILNCANYGDPTTRNRLFIQAKRTRGAISWPAPTHTVAGGADLFGATERWKTARNSVIDWSLPGRLLSARRRPLEPTTGARIEVGKRRYPGEPFLINYNGTGTAHSVDEPLGTVSTRDRFALLVPEGRDLRYRMLEPHELARAMSFPAEYQFSGSRADQIKQIGNAVPVRTSAALCRAILAA